MDELTLLVPTYNGYAYPDETEEFGDPYVPVHVYREDGVRIVLGSDDRENIDAPDINIERRPHGWAIFLHPLGGSDASGYAYFLDDGRSFLVKELGLGPTPVIEIVDSHSDIPGLDAPDGVHLVPRSVDSMTTDEAYELVSEIRGLAFWDERAQAWDPDQEVGPEFVAAVKNLLKRYRLQPRSTRRSRA